MGIARKLVLNTLFEFARMYSTAVMASRMIKVADYQWEEIKKEGSSEMLSAEDVDLIHLNPELVSYESSSKEIHTEALQVTMENIGKLSLEFEQDMCYDPSGRPFFMFIAQREKEANGRGVYIRLTDWILPLHGEIHVFRDQIFRNTFTFDNPNVAIHQATLSSPSLANVQWGDVHPVLPYDGDINLMDAARSSENPELRALAEKLSKPLPRSVRHKSTGAYGAIESFGEAGKVWVRMADQDEVLEYDRNELEDIS